MERLMRLMEAGRATCRRRLFRPLEVRSYLNELLDTSELPLGSPAAVVADSSSPLIPSSAHLALTPPLLIIRPLQTLLQHLNSTSSSSHRPLALLNEELTLRPLAFGHRIFWRWAWTRASKGTSGVSWRAEAGAAKRSERSGEKEVEQSRRRES
jgi:hypothetical protein